MTWPVTARCWSIAHTGPHTGHVSLLVEDGDRRTLLAGDLVHTPADLRSVAPGCRRLVHGAQRRRARGSRPPRNIHAVSAGAREAGRQVPAPFSRRRSGAEESSGASKAGAVADRPPRATTVAAARSRGVTRIVSAARHSVRRLAGEPPASTARLASAIRRRRYCRGTQIVIEPSPTLARNVAEGRHPARTSASSEVVRPQRALERRHEDERAGAACRRGTSRAPVRCARIGVCLPRSDGGREGVGCRSSAHQPVRCRQPRRRPLRHPRRPHSRSPPGRAAWVRRSRRRGITSAAQSNTTPAIASQPRAVHRHGSRPSERERAPSRPRRAVRGTRARPESEARTRAREPR